MPNIKENNLINTSNNSPIGFFDSGVGGLSVFSIFKKILPNENTLYYGDLKNMPYGNKTREELVGFARNILDFFKSKGVKAVVIACNTSSANVYELIKNEYDFEIYPIIQSCAKVISSMNVDRIGVFATMATVNSGAYTRELHKYNSKINVYEVGCPLWTNFVESGNTHTPECSIDVELKVKEILKYNPQKIILGCTHYPYLLNVLSKYAQREMFIDPAEIFVDYIKTDLGQKSLLNNSNQIGSEEFYVSANPDDFIKNAELFYKIKNECELIR